MAAVLVTGGSGFVGSYCILQLLQAGHHVRTTVRKQSRQTDVEAMLKAGGLKSSEGASFIEADLENDRNWPEAMQGCEYVLHVASPFGGSARGGEDAMIAQARDGALRVLRAAKDAGVRRTVMTSSFGAIGYGHPNQQKPFTEEDWTDLSKPDVHAYIKSKVLAERAAWDFMKADGGSMDLAVINPVGIFGPVLGPDYSSSVDIIKNLLRGAMPATPRMYFGLVDVRDVADIHIRAMTSPVAANQRFIAVAGDTLSMHEVAMILRRRLGDKASRVPRFQMPDLLVRFLARFQPRLREVSSQVGKKRLSSNEKARTLLGWNPRSNEEVIVATAESLFAHG